MIDEKKLIEELKDYRDRSSLKMTKETFNFVIERIEEQPKINKWIPVEEAMPPEHDSIFRKYKGTDEWKNGMFEKISDHLDVTVEFEDGERRVGTARTCDGKWRFGVIYKAVKPKKVIAWCPRRESYEG